MVKQASKFLIFALALVGLAVLISRGVDHVREMRDPAVQPAPHVNDGPVPDAVLQGARRGEDAMLVLTRDGGWYIQPIPEDEVPHDPACLRECDLSGTEVRATAPPPGSGGQCPSDQGRNGLRRPR